MKRNGRRSGQRRPRDLVRLAVRQGLGPTLVGTAAGIAMVIFLARINVALLAAAGVLSFVALGAR